MTSSFPADDARDVEQVAHQSLLEPGVSVDPLQRAALLRTGERSRCPADAASRGWPRAVSAARGRPARGTDLWPRCALTAASRAASARSRRSRAWSACLRAVTSRNTSTIADDIAVRSPDRRRAVVDRSLSSVTSEEQGVIGEPHHLAFAKDTADWALERFPRQFADNRKYLLERGGLRLRSGSIPSALRQRGLTIVTLPASSVTMSASPQLCRVACNLASPSRARLWARSKWSTTRRLSSQAAASRPAPCQPSDDRRRASHWLRRSCAFPTGGSRPASRAATSAAVNAAVDRRVRVVDEGI